MERDECWMTFSEALAQYLAAEKEMDHFGQGGHNWRSAGERRREAAEHMDALTSLPKGGA